MDGQRWAHQLGLCILHSKTVQEGDAFARAPSFALHEAPPREREARYVGWRLLRGLLLYALLLKGFVSEEIVPWLNVSRA